MENYRVLELIGKGAQGSVYLAERLDDPNQNKCVLKKIECHDESAANEAYREAVKLEKLQHPYISTYKDFFVMWEKETSSMYLCIVSQFYREGNLSSVLQSYRENNQPIEEEEVKKYLGEILQALIFVHKKGILHRDLKCSNVFLQDDKTVCLGDFGVETVMLDACTNTRNTIGSKNYMAPELGVRGYSEKSDVWSVGCILFELCTTSLYHQQQQVTNKLREVRENPLVLEDVFEDIATHFSGELICVIRCMLKVQHEKRKSIAELTEIKYIKECLEMSDVFMVEKRKRQALSRSEVRSISPERQGVLSILEHIAKSIDHESLVREGLEQLVTVTQSDDSVLLDNKSKLLVAMAMKNNIEDKGVQIAGCRVLNNLVLKAEGDDILYCSDVITVVSGAMKQHVTCAELQQRASSLLMAMSSDGNACHVISEVGAIENIITAMRSFPDDPNLCSTCCSALWSLTVNERNLQQASKCNALKDVCRVLDSHMLIPEVVESAAAAVISLTLDDSVVKYVNDIDCVGHLINAISTHIKHPKVVKNSCMAISSLVQVNEESAYRVLTAEDVDGVTGIPVIIKAYNLHKDNSEVVETVINLVVDLAQYDDLNAELRYLKVGPTVLSEVYKRFKPTRDIMSPCERALDLLGNKTQKATEKET